MKRLAVFFFTGILCLGLTACGGNGSDRTPIPDATSSSPAQSQPPASESTSEAVSASTYDIEAARVDAAKQWSTFLDSVSVLETDSKYAPILKVTEDTSSFCARYYEKVTGNSEEEYLSLSAYEKFLWYNTYIFPTNATTASGYDTYFSSLAKWNSNVAGNGYGLLKSQGATEQAEAYKTLMEWQYNFFLETGCMYNFITEKTSAEENPNYVIPDPVKQRAEQAAQEQKEIQEVQDELQNEKK